MAKETSGSDTPYQAASAVGAGPGMAAQPTPKAMFARWFAVATAGTNDRSRLYKQAAVKFLERSGLAESIIAEVWSVASDGSSTLTFDRFCTAMELVAMQQRGEVISRDAHAALKAQLQTVLLPKLGEELDALEPLDPTAVPIPSRGPARMLPSVFGSRGHTPPDNAASPHGRSPVTPIQMKPVAVQLDIDTARNLDRVSPHNVSDSPQGGVAVQLYDMFAVDDIAAQAEEQAAATSRIGSDIAFLGGMVFDTLLGLADKLPDPGPFAAKLVKGIVDHASQAFYNKQNCAALSARSQVLLKVMCEHQGAFVVKGSLQEIMEQFKNVMVDVEAFVKLFTSENMLRSILRSNDNQETYIKLWGRLNDTRSDLILGLVAADASAVKQQLSSLHTEVLRWEGQEKRLQAAIVESGGWNAVVQRGQISQEIKGKMGIEGQLLVDAIEKGTAGPLRRLERWSPEIQLQDVCTRSQLEEQFSRPPHQLQFLTNLPNYDDNISMISVFELTSAIERYMIGHPDCGFVELMLGLSSPSSPRQRLLLPQRSLASYQLAECRRADVDRVLELLMGTSASPSIVAIVGAPGQGLTTLAKELVKRFLDPDKLQMAVHYIDLRDIPKAKDVLQLIRTELKLHDQADCQNLVDLLKLGSAVLHNTAGKSGELVIILDHCDLLLVSLKLQHPLDLPDKDAKRMLDLEATDEFRKLASLNGSRDGESVLARVADACGCMPFAIRAVITHVISILFEDMLQQRPGWLARVETGSHGALSELAAKFVTPITQLKAVQRSRLLALAILPAWFTQSLVEEVLEIDESEAAGLLKALDSKWLVECNERAGKQLWRAHPLVRALAHEPYECAGGTLLWDPTAWQSLKGENGLRSKFVIYCSGKLRRAHSILDTYARLFDDQTGLLEAGGYLFGPDITIWKAALKKCVKYAEQRCKAIGKGEESTIDLTQTSIYAKLGLGQLLYIAEWYGNARNCMSDALRTLEDVDVAALQQPAKDMLLQLRVRLLLMRARCNYNPLSERGIAEALGDLKSVQDLREAHPALLVGAQLDAAVNEQRGLCKDAMHEWECAEQLLRECLQTRKSLHGSRHLDVAQAQCGLSQILMNRDNYSEACKVTLAALETRQALLPQGHSDIGKVMLLRAKALRSDRAEARVLLEKALEIGRTLPRLKPHLEHPLTADCMVCVANIMKKEAEEVTADAIRQQRITLGKPDDPEAGKRHRKAYELRKAHLGNHPATAESANCLAKVLLQQAESADPEECETLRSEFRKLCIEAQDILKNWRGDDTHTQLRDRITQNALLAFPWRCPVTGRGAEAGSGASSTESGLVDELRQAIAALNAANRVTTLENHNVMLQQHLVELQNLLTAAHQRSAGLQSELDTAKETIGSLRDELKISQRDLECLITRRILRSAK
ncbi:hypothetical protein WJX72_007423 [[Myrmecia] bisecta]|uniref:EH domain-containing protein n=1 Tax=[Myrmecia] bisecta TaxID=41462 RepID=A0AAW1P785_9CHLO